MNPYGSYRSLLGNSMSAMLAGIEIYNKPRIEYRTECFVILLLNAWELLFKAICSKNRIRIFEPKERGKPYRTIKLWDALDAARAYFPKDIPLKAVAENIGRLVDYRNNAVHFYNQESLGVIIYGLAQTSIVNYRDIVLAIFGKDIASEVNIALLPLSFSAPPDPIKFLGSKGKHSAAISEFLQVISETTRELENEGIDTGRFLTVFEVNLQSTKKVKSADIVAGVESSSSSGVLLVSRKVDPNKSHPHLRRVALEKIGEKVKGVPFTSHTFQAVTGNMDLKIKTNTVGTIRTQAHSSTRMTLLSGSGIVPPKRFNQHWMTTATICASGGKMPANKAVNADAFFVRCAHYKCAGYGWR